MSTLSPKDRVSLCMFSFADGRVAALRASATVPISATTTPKKKLAPVPRKVSARTSPATSPANISPPAISAPLWAASSPPSSAAMSNPRSPAPSPTWPKLSCSPSTFPSTNIARPSAPIPGANPSAPPSTATTSTASRPIAPAAFRPSFPRNPSNPATPNLNRSLRHPLPPPNNQLRPIPRKRP
jgi:hypothetical protein